MQMAERDRLLLLRAPLLRGAFVLDDAAEVDEVDKGVVEVTIRGVVVEVEVDEEDEEDAVGVVVGVEIEMGGSGIAVDSVPTVIVVIVVDVVGLLESVEGMGMDFVAEGSGLSNEPFIPSKLNHGEKAS